MNGIANAAVLVGTPLTGLTFSMGGEGRVGFAVIAVLWLAALAALPREAPVIVPVSLPARRHPVGRRR